jgi:hypothetical protein
LFVSTFKSHIERVSFPPVLETVFAFAHQVEVSREQDFTQRTFAEPEVGAGAKGSTQDRQDQNQEGMADESDPVLRSAADKLKRGVVTQEEYEEILSMHRRNSDALRPSPAASTAFAMKLSTWTNLSNPASAGADGNGLWGVEGNGWGMFNPQREFIRQGVQLQQKGGDAGTGTGKNSLWQLYPPASSSASEFYTLSPTYPQQYLVPTLDTFPEQRLQQVARFRARARLPAIVWV